MSYTSNWPHEPLVGNFITTDAVVWTGVSIILLLAGIGGLAFFHATRQGEPMPEVHPETDPLLSAASTPSQRATVKYFWVVSALMLVQMLARTWHVQLGVLWIATAWLAAGLYIAPAI